MISDEFQVPRHAGHVVLLTTVLPPRLQTQIRLNIAYIGRDGNASEGVGVVVGVGECELAVRRPRRQRAPHHLQHEQRVVERELALELQQQPAVAEEHVVGPVALEIAEEVRVVMLQQQRQVLEHQRHGVAVVSKIRAQPCHQTTETDIGVRFVVLNIENGRGEVTHTLTVRHLRVRQRVRRQQIKQ